jgi:hypothetical protein
VAVGDAVNGKSGANYFSNVSILQEMNLIEDPALEVAVYVEGIGTDDGEDDCTLGSGFGAGPTGIAAKVSRASPKSRQESPQHWAMKSSWARCAWTRSASAGARRRRGTSWPAPRPRTSRATQLYAPS